MDDKYFATLKNKNNEKKKWFVVQIHTKVRVYLLLLK